MCFLRLVFSTPMALDFFFILFISSLLEFKYFFNELDKFLSNPKNSTDNAKYWNSLNKTKKRKALNSFVEFLKKGKI